MIDFHLRAPPLVLGALRALRTLRPWGQGHIRSDLHFTAILALMNMQLTFF